MKKLLIVLFGVLAFQGYVFAESWEDFGPQVIPLGVLIFQMILLVGIVQSNGIP